MKRRAFLRCAGGSLLALPLLEACDRVGIDRVAEPLRTDRAQRLIAFGLWNGVIPRDWFPAATGRDFTLPVMLEPLAAHREDLVILKDVHNLAAFDAPRRNGHAEGVSSLLSGISAVERAPETNDWVGRGITIDQSIAAHIERTSPTRYPSLQVGVSHGGGGYGAVSYAGPDQPLDANTSPESLFSLLFRDSLAGAEAAQAARRRRASILDGTRGDYERMCQRISGEDRRRCEAHLESVRQVERQIARGAACDPSQLSLDGREDHRGAGWSAMIDIILLAMSCDLTRVATFTFDHAGGGGPHFTWLGIDEDVHEISHQVVEDPPGSQSHTRFRAVHRWYNEHIARLIAGMKEIVLPDGQTLFDGTVVLTGSELGFNHNDQRDDMPFLIAAGSRTPFARGRCVGFPSKVPHNHLLVTLGRSFGLELDAFGDAAFGRGNLDAQLLG